MKCLMKIKQNEEDQEPDQLLMQICQEYQRDDIVEKSAVVPQLPLTQDGRVKQPQTEHNSKREEAHQAPTMTTPQVGLTKLTWTLMSDHISPLIIVMVIRLMSRRF